MPIVRTMLDLQDVVPILLARGYGLHRNRAYELQLTVPGKRQFKTTGAFEREPLKGMSKAEVVAVLQKAETHEEAANLFEMFSRGQIGSVVEQVEQAPNGSGLSAEQLAHIIDNRVALGVHREMEQVRSEFADLRAEMGALVDECRALLDGKKATAPKKKAKKPGRPTPDEVEEMVAALGIPTVPPPEQE